MDAAELENMRRTAETAAKMGGANAEVDGAIYKRAFDSLAKELNKRPLIAKVGEMMQKPPKRKSEQLDFGTVDQWDFGTVR